MELNNSEEKTTVQNLLNEENKKEKVTFFEKGGLYSKISKSREGIKGATIFLILSGFVFIGSIILGIVLL